jgi:hypothetical protein
MVRAERSSEKRPCGVGLCRAALLYSVEAQICPLRLTVRGAKRALQAQSQSQDVRAVVRIFNRRCPPGASRPLRFSLHSLHGSSAVCGRRSRSAAIPRRSQSWPWQASIFARATCEPACTRLHSLVVSKKLFTFLAHQSGARQARTKNKHRSFAALRTMTGSNKSARRIGPSWKLLALLRREGQAAIVAWPSAEERVEYNYEIWRTSAGELFSTRSRMPLPARIFRLGFVDVRVISPSGDVRPACSMATLE